MARSCSVLALLVVLAPVALADADLELILHHPRAGAIVPVPAGQAALLEFSIRNNGPDLARDVVATIELPPGVSLRYLDDARCDYAARPVVCRAGDIAPAADGVRPFRLYVATPLSEGTHTVTLTAGAATPDPRPDDNRAAAGYESRFGADLSVRVQPGFVRADPGETVTVQVTIDNLTQTIEPTEVRLRLVANGGTIESVTPPAGWICSGGGIAAECVGRALPVRYDQLKVAFRTSDDRAGGESTLRAHASSNLPEFHEPNDAAILSAARYRWIVVTSTGDGGAGSLRAAIEEANGCGTAPCKIAFEIAGAVPAEGWFTIQPSSPLPAIAGDRVFVDGSTQTRFSGDTNPRGPEIAIDGRFTASGHGLRIGSRCEAQVTHLAIGNFREHGISAVHGALCISNQIEPRRIARNHIGVDPGGTSAWPNLRGVEVLTTGVPFAIEDNVISGNRRSGIWSAQGGFYAHRNRIGTGGDGTTPLPNGASGVYIGPRVSIAEVLQNTIAYNQEMGVAIARGADQIDVRENSMRENGGLGIDWELDGVSPPRNDEGLEPSNAPVLLAARYDAARNRTIVTVRVETRRFGPSDGPAFLDFYANDTPDGDGERHAGNAGYAPNVRGEAFEMELPGDFRGKWLNATSTRLYYLFSEPPDDEVASQNLPGGGITRTSELSNAVRVMP